MSLGPSFPLIPLLRLSWLFATIPIIISFVFKPIHQTITHLSSRGKTLTSSRSSLTVPQSYFIHFYALAFLLTTSLLISICFYAHYIQEVEGKEMVRVWRSVFLLALMEVQVVRRLYETAMVFDYSRSAKMHVLGYCTGLFFYTAAPLSVANECAHEALSYVGGKIAEFIVRGRENMPFVAFSWQFSLKPLISLGWCQVIGSAIFVWGWIHQLRCHAILGSLRKHKGSDEYVIPHGDWFEYVSCPHYLAEIIIYAGILVASGGLDLTIWHLFFFVVCYIKMFPVPFFVVANLVVAAAETHRWYLYKFESYPKTRLAVIPFVY